MPSFFIFQCNVERFIPRRAAAPFGPPSTQAVSWRTPRMCSRSASARVEPEVGGRKSLKGPLPSYRLKKSRGQAVVTLTDPSGARHDVLLGKYNSPESRAELLRVLGEWEARGRTRLRSIRAAILEASP
jgi:hypothetical protein